jgi:hypothetical protein
MADQQRVMAWAALGTPPVLIAFLAFPWVTLEKVNALAGLTTTYCAAMGTMWWLHGGTSVCQRQG